MGKIQTTSELAKAQRDRIRAAIDGLIQELAAELSLETQTVANSVFYRLQGHPLWGRNPTRKQKCEAYDHAGGICCGCRKQVDRTEAKFHHVQRGFPNQHAAENMRPIHKECHDKLHDVKNGSLS